MSETKIAAVVTQGELELIARHRREMAWHKAELEKSEKDVMHLLMAGAEVEPGRFTACVCFKSRRSLSWKSLVIKELGKTFAQQASNTARLMKIPALRLTEHARTPIWSRKAS